MQHLAIAQILMGAKRIGPPLHCKRLALPLLLYVALHKQAAVGTGDHNPDQELPDTLLCFTILAPHGSHDAICCDRRRQQQIRKQELWRTYLNVESVGLLPKVQ